MILSRKQRTNLPSRKRGNKKSEVKRTWSAKKNRKELRFEEKDREKQPSNKSFWSEMGINKKCSSLLYDRSSNSVHLLSSLWLLQDLTFWFSKTDLRVNSHWRERVVLENSSNSWQTSLYFILRSRLSSSCLVSSLSFSFPSAVKQGRLEASRYLITDSFSLKATFLPILETEFKSWQDFMTNERILCEMKISFEGVISFKKETLDSTIQLIVELGRWRVFCQEKNSHHDPSFFSIDFKNDIVIEVHQRWWLELIVIDCTSLFPFEGSLDSKPFKTFHALLSPITLLSIQRKKCNKKRGREQIEWKKKDRGWSSSEENDSIFQSTKCLLVVK